MARTRIATAVSVLHIHSVESRESLPLTAPSLENAFIAILQLLAAFSDGLLAALCESFDHFDGEHRLRMGSCLARLACLKLCYANVLSFDGRFKVLSDRCTGVSIT